MEVCAYHISTILIGSALIFTVPTWCLTPGQIVAIENLTEAIKTKKISKEDARKKALSFNLSGSNLNHSAVQALVLAADANGIPEILKQVSKPVNPTKPVALQKTETPVTKPISTTPELQGVSKVIQSNAPLATQKPALIPLPTKLPEATFNALKEKLKFLKKNHTTMGTQEIEKAIQEIKNGFQTVPIPTYMTAILKKIEGFKDQLAKDSAAMNALSAQFMEQGLKNKLTDPKVIKQLPVSMKETQEKINAIRARYKLNKSIQSAAANALRTVQNGLYKLIQESMKQAAQLNDNALLFKLIKKYANVVFHSEKQLEHWLQRKREQELNIELKHIEKLRQEKKDATIQKSIEEEKELIIKELSALREEQSKTLQREEQNTDILIKLETDDHHMRISPEELGNQLALIDEEQLSEPQLEIFDTMRVYLDDLIPEAETLAAIDTDINVARSFAQNPRDVALADRYLSTLEKLIVTCKEKLKFAKKGSWLAQQFEARIKTLEPLRNSVAEAWEKLENEWLKQQTVEIQMIDALTQTTGTPSAATTPMPSQPSKESEFEAAVKKANELIKHPTDAAEMERQAKELDTLLDYYRTQKIEGKIDTLKSLIKQLDAITEKLDEEYRTKKPTQAEIEAHLQSDIEDIISNFEKQNPGITSGHAPLSLESSGFKGEPQFSQNPNPVIPILKEKKFPESPGLEKIKIEEEQQIEQLRKQNLIKEDL